MIYLLLHLHLFFLGLIDEYKMLICVFHIVCGIFLLYHHYQGDIACWRVESFYLIVISIKACRLSTFFVCETSREQLSDTFDKCIHQNKYTHAIRPGAQQGCHSNGISQQIQRRQRCVYVCAVKQVLCGVFVMLSYTLIFM